MKWRRNTTDSVSKTGPKLGFESEIEGSKFDIQMLSEEKARMQDELKILHLVQQTITKLYALGLQSYDIVLLGQMYLNIFNRTYSMEDLADVMTQIVDIMLSVTNRSGTIQKDKVSKILGKLRDCLSQMPLVT